ncbi:RsmB/NOP family class I SAM-dependent RNA methyltransferase [Candidatus Woesearchaeota archaeon]|nr:RsmB/NOP family class I SAM-dependent RNA methyltransferase [Candidatus Woesearchaeota archaeon]
MPNAGEIEFKKQFVERYSKLTEFDDFKRYCLAFLRRSIRVNTLKISIKELKKRLEKDWKLEQIPWCREGFWIEHKREDRRDIGNLIEHSLGYFYVQEAVSMIPPLVLDPKPGETVLDMCAAPGSKASQIAQYMKNKGVLVANDYKGIRLAPLGINMQRMGITNSVLTLMDANWFAKSGLEFDRILLDAPCSGTGTIRKSLKTLRIWNSGMIKKISYDQRRLAETAFSILKKGGTMVYSTCSLEPEEDEGVVSLLLENHPDAKLEEISLGIKRSHAIEEFEGVRYNPEVKKCLRLWPQDNDTEGFFVAKIKKV